MIFQHATRSLRETFPVRASEWALSFMLFSWGAILLLNNDLFSLSPSYHSFSEVMPEAAWGSVCLLVGSARLTFLFVNGLWRRSPHLRLLGAFVSCFFWFQITASFVFSGTWATGLAIYPFLFLLDVHNTLRAATDAAIIDKKYAEKRNGTYP
jgi:vacuolar-type H+-ATPase subunit I/STV1